MERGKRIMNFIVKKIMHKVMALTLCLVMTVPLLLGPVSVAALTDDSYTFVDYSTRLALDTPASGSTSYEGEYIDTQIWWFYLDKGYTISLTAGEAYLFTYTVSMKGNDEDVLEPTLIILTGGDFAGYASEYNGDCLAHNEDSSWGLESSINLVFVPPATGDYRVLTGCALNDGYAVDTELLVSKIQVIEPAWKADPCHSCRRCPVLL